MLQAACDVFCVGDDVNIEKANNSLISNDRSWKRSKFRLTYVAEAPELTQGTDSSPPGHWGFEYGVASEKAGKPLGAVTSFYGSRLTVVLDKFCALWVFNSLIHILLSL